MMSQRKLSKKHPRSFTAAVQGVSGGFPEDFQRISAGASLLGHTVYLLFFKSIIIF